MPTSLKDPNSAENDARRKLEDPYIARSARELNNLHNLPTHEREDPIKTHDTLKDLEEAGTKIPSSNNEKSIDSRENAGTWETKFGTLKPKQSKNEGRFRIFKKKRTWLIFGGGLFSIGVFLGGIFQGPLQLIQLASILQKPFAGMERDNQARGSAMMRYWQTGEVGQTRLTFVGARIAEKAMQSMERGGVKAGSRNALGNVKSWDLDSKKHPSTKGKLMTISQQRSAIAKFYGISESKVKVTSRGGGLYAGTFSIESNYNINMNDRVVDKTLDAANEKRGLGGRISTAQNQRVLKRYFGIPRLFSPVDKKTAEQRAKFIGWLSNKEEAAKERREQRRTARGLNPQGTIATKISEAKEKINSKPGLIKSAGAGLTFTAAACAARGIASSVAWANRAAIVTPAVIEATHYMSLGDQVKSGEDMSMEDAGFEADFLTDKDGKSVFDSQPLNALSSQNPKGKELDFEYKTAFTNEDVETDINNKFGLGGVGGIVCSPLGLLIQGTVGAGLTAASCATLVGCAVAAAKFAGSSIASQLAVAFLSDKFIDMLANDGVDFESLPKDQVGGLMAYGTRTGANMNAIASGGTELSETDKRVMFKEQKEEEMKELQSQPLLARLFNTKDDRSILSQTILKTNLNYKSLSGFASSFNNIRLAASSSAASVMLPSALAQDEDYDWGFPLYGMSRDVFNDSEFANPYVNGEKVAAIFKDENGEDDEDHEYIKRSMKCFGTKISKGTNGWQAVAEEDVNPASKEYHDAGCNEKNKDWNRVKMFVFDSRLADAMDCFDSNDEVSQESCANLDIESTTAESTDSVGDANMMETVKVDTPGKFIKMPSHYSCAGRETRIDSRIAPALAYLLEKYDMCADDGLASGHLSHGAGLGVDIRPKDQSKQMDKEEWKNTVEKAARDMGWWGDSADQPKSSKGCATYSGYGQCVGGNGDIPKWVRWIGYNGDVDHGDPWHIFGGSYAHIHIGWASPNGDDAVSSSEISQPIPAVYTFPAPVPDDLKGLIE